MYCRSNFCDIYIFVCNQRFVQLGHGILGIILVRLAKHICGILVIFLYVQPKVQKLAIDSISTYFQSLAYNHEVNCFMCVA
jgi:hypothetical protein